MVKVAGLLSTLPSLMMSTTTYTPTWSGVTEMVAVVEDTVVTEAILFVGFETKYQR